MKAFFTLSLLFVGALTMSAQQITTDTLHWQVNSFTEHPAETSSTKASVFETKPGLIRWIQKNGTFVYEFSVTGTTGTWNDVSQLGEFTYQVTFRGYTGTVRFVRTQTEVLIEPDIKKNGTNLFPYTFHVSTISQQ